jgi:hypothetical protein
MGVDYARILPINLENVSVKKTMLAHLPHVCGMIRGQPSYYPQEYVP